MTTDNIEQSSSEPLHQIERQLERGSLFTHTALSNNAERIIEAEAFLYALADMLIQKGIVTQQEILAQTEQIRQEMFEKGEMLGPGIVLRMDAEAPPPDEDFIPVNCEERLHICKAVCCRMSFSLSANEVEGGTVKWDLGRPYHIRQEQDGYCTHLSREGQGCHIYHDRPRVCRRYSCANDSRVWKNFEAMELNEEWISQNLGSENKPRLARVSMIRLDEIQVTSDDIPASTLNEAETPE
jgi:Fe-S-cluster containining protein